MLELNLTCHNLISDLEFSLKDRHVMLHCFNLNAIAIHNHIPIKNKKKNNYNPDFGTNVKIYVASYNKCNSVKAFLFTHYFFVVSQQ